MTVATSDGKERNNFKISLPDEDGAALKWTVARILKLMGDRKLTADQIVEVRRAAKNDGYKAETLQAAVRLAKMTPERRTAFADEFGEALSLFGFETSVAGEDPRSKRAELLRAHVNKTVSLARDKAEIGQEIRLLYATAKERGFDVPALKQVVKVGQMDPDDREEWFARVDKIGACVGYW